MIDDLLTWARESWRAWFGRPATFLSPAVLAGGPAHQQRFALFLFEGTKSHPDVFVKVSLDEKERKHVEAETTAIESLRGISLPLLNAQLPRSFGRHEIGSTFAAAYGVLAGRRINVPPLLGHVGRGGQKSMTRFWGATSEFGMKLAAMTPRSDDLGDERQLGERVGAFLATFEVDSGTRRNLEAFQRNLERERISWSPVWQHGDLAVGNVLLDGNGFRFLDWEAARDDYEPWFDLTTAPPAAVVLGCRQTGQTPGQVAPVVLSRTAWAGASMSREIEKHWNQSFPIGWAILLTTMRMALRRSNEGRTMHSEYSSLVAQLAADPHIRTDASWAAI